MSDARLAAEFIPAVLMDAARAPSVHNVQPARWRWLDDGRVELFEETRCRLAAADAAGNDAWMSLGAAWEGLQLALSQHDLALGDAQLHLDRAQRLGPLSSLRLVATATLQRADHRDPLAAAVHKRRSYRGLFPQLGDADQAALAAACAADPALIPIFSRDERERLAGWHDTASYRCMRDAAYAAELYQWLRLSRHHPRWALDGLNADALALHPLEAKVAGRLLRPQAFALLAKLGLAAPLVSERRQILSAPAVLALTTAADAHPFAVGRQFYRQWLELANHGVALAPMSALTDDPEARRAVEALVHLPATQRVYLVARAGKIPVARIARSPRCDIRDMLVP